MDLAPLLLLPDGPEIAAVRRFFARVLVTSDGHWLWLGALNERGYGVVRWRGRLWKAHRLCWTLLEAPWRLEPLPPALVLHHECRVRACVYPAHLAPTDRGTNAKDGALARWAFWRAARDQERRLQYLLALDDLLLSVGGSP